MRLSGHLISHFHFVRSNNVANMYIGSLVEYLPRSIGAEMSSGSANVSSEPHCSTVSPSRVIVEYMEINQRRTPKHHTKCVVILEYVEISQRSTTKHDTKSVKQ